MTEIEAYETLAEEQAEAVRAEAPARERGLLAAACERQMEQGETAETETTQTDLRGINWLHDAIAARDAEIEATTTDEDRAREAAEDARREAAHDRGERCGGRDYSALRHGPRACWCATSKPVLNAHGSWDWIES